MTFSFKRVRIERQKLLSLSNEIELITVSGEKSAMVFRNSVTTYIELEFWSTIVMEVLNSTPGLFFLFRLID